MNDSYKLFNTDVNISWCPGCGDFAILLAIKEALFELGLKPNNTLIVSGIGQAAKTPQYIKANNFNSLHGRALPPTIGMKVANNDLNIFVTSGDGDTYGEGGNHFIHNIRRNPNIVHLVYNNRVYGLTKGQGSPTTDLGQTTTMQLNGSYLTPLNPITLAMTLGAGFIGRAYSGDKRNLIDLIKKAFEYNGYALIDVLQPCPSFNKINTASWYKKNTYNLEKNYDPKDFYEAYKTSLNVIDHIALGLLYYKETTPYLDRLPHYEGSLVNRKWKPTDAIKLLDDFI